MQLRPVHKQPSPEYPSTSSYKRMYVACLSAATVLGVVSGAGGLDATAMAADETAPKQDQKDDDQQKVKDAIKLLITQLGHRKSKVRQEATVKLIQLGKCKNKEGEQPNRELVLESVKPLQKNDDPEVATRATRVVKALTAKKPVVKEEVEVLEGDIMIE